MKRYTLPELLSGAKNGTVTLDGEYVLYSDLIAAGVLVPVPDGEECKIDANILVLHNGRLCRTDTRWDDFFPFEMRDEFTGKFVDKVGKSTIVQPVRLVPLAELEAES